MKPIADAKMDDLEELAMESAKQLRQFFKYEGTDGRFFQKARLATGVIGAYARIRASETNRMAVELAVQRQIGDAPAPKQIGKAR